MEKGKIIKNGNVNLENIKLDGKAEALNIQSIQLQDASDIKLIQWIAQYCVSTYRFKEQQWKLAFLSDAAVLWDGVDDDKLKWFTPEEMLVFYKENKTATLG